MIIFCQHLFLNHRLDTHAIQIIMRDSLVVNTTLNYQLEGAADSFQAGTVGHYLRKFDAQKVQITDIRVCNEEFDIDKQGFKIYQHISAETTFDNDTNIRETVYPETAEFLKEVYVISSSSDAYSR
jgi:hypothetical protein